MLSCVVYQEQDFPLLCVTLASISSSCLQKKVELTISPSPRIFQYIDPSEQKKERCISFLPWVCPLRNGLRIFIDVTPFKGVVRISVRYPFFVLGNDEVSSLSVGGTIKPQSANFKVPLQLLWCEVIRDDSWPFKALAFSWRARRTVYLKASISAYHFCIPFLGFAQTAQSILTLLRMTGVPDHDRSFRLSNFLNRV